MTTSMTSTRLPFYPVYLVAIFGSLAIFTAVIGGGRLTGPGVALALSVGALLWVARLLFDSARALVATGSDAEQSEALAASGRRKKELEREYYILKRAIKELELDHAMGKISTEDYGEIRTRYRERAVRVLRQLDQGETYRSQIEADLTARRAARGLSVAAKAPAEAKPAADATPAPSKEEAVAVAASPSQEPVTASPAATESKAAVQQQTCPNCGASNDADAVFCKKCGSRLAAAAATA
jgi:ribosomal protein L40E